MLKCLGWRVSGQFPNEPKAVIALGPHTSNWDFVISMAAIMASGVRVSYLMKKEAFVWPFSIFCVWLGGVPLNRKATENTVDQLVARFLDSDKLWVAIAPEGTRKKVDYWKSGFLRIAHKADIPVICVTWDYQQKLMCLDRVWQATEHYEQEAEAIREYVRTHFKGRYPDQQ